MTSNKNEHYKVFFKSLGAVEGGHVLLTSQNGGQYFGWEIVMTIKITFKI